jgi:hypothetical protein
MKSAKSPVKAMFLASFPFAFPMLKKCVRREGGNHSHSHRHRHRHLAPLGSLSLSSPCLACSRSQWKPRRRRKRSILGVRLAGGVATHLHPRNA